MVYSVKTQKNAEKTNRSAEEVNISNTLRKIQTQESHISSELQDRIDDLVRAER